MATVWKFANYEGEKLLVLLALADWSNDEGVCWPSVSSIAKKARITERGARGILKVLISDGKVEILEQGGGRGNNTVYRLHVETLNTVPPLGAETLNVAATKPGTYLQRNKEEPSLEPPSRHPSDGGDKKPSPPARKKGKSKTPPDPRIKPFFLATQRIQQQRTQLSYTWGQGDFGALKNLLRSVNLLTEDVLRQWLDNYWNSDNINTADPPRVYLHRLVKYRLGALSQYGTLKNPRSTSAAVVEEVESPVHELRRQLAGR